MTGRTFAFGLLALALLGAAPAFAGSTLNNPRGAWSVGPINAESSSGVGFCSMKNVYDDGKALVFARDAEGSNSIAVSFTEKKFMVSGAQYQVNLDADGLKRTMVALAATPTVLIVQMGLDRDFYTILRKKNVLSIGLRDKQYGFSLSGTADALDALTKCAQDVAAGKVYKQTDIAVAPVQGPAMMNANTIIPGVPVSPVPTMDNANSGQQAADSVLRAEIERLKLENRRLMAENMAATAKAIAADHGQTAANAQVQKELEAQARALKLAEQQAAFEASQPKSAIAPVVVPAKVPAPAAAPVEAVEASALPVTSATPASKVDSAKTQAVPQNAAAPTVPQLAAKADVQAAAKPEAAPIDKEDMKILLAAEPAAGDSTPPVQPVAPFLYSLLKKAGITPTTQGLGYVWLTNNIYGAAEERRVDPGKSLADSTTRYVAEAAMRCKGDFAHKEGVPVKMGQVNVLESEVACIDGKNDAAAALLFVEEKGKVAIITHEGMADQMETALSQRDAVKSAVSR